MSKKTPPIITVLRQHGKGDPIAPLYVQSHTDAGRDSVTCPECARKLEYRSTPRVLICHPCGFEWDVPTQVFVPLAGHRFA